MSDNHATPPGALVEQGLDLRAPGRARPRQITVAILLLWAVFCVAALSVASSWTGLTELAPRLMRFLLIGMALLVAALNVGVARGWNWARIVYLVLVLLSFWRFVHTLPAVLEVSPVLAAVGILQNAMELGAMYLVFVSPGRAWFRR